MRHSLKNKRILVTCGPTWVAIDPVRVISNRSTGVLAQLIAQRFADAGAKVTLLEGAVEQPLKTGPVKVRKFRFFGELKTAMRTELRKNCAVCIHAAAVSDYTVKRARNTKLSSDLKHLRLDLIPAEKIIRSVKKWRPNVFLVGFKLETKVTRSSAARQTQALFRNSRCDLAVANVAHSRTYSGYIVGRDQTVRAHIRSRRQLAKALVAIVKDSL